MAGNRHQRRKAKSQARSVMKRITALERRIAEMKDPESAAQ